MPAQTWIALAIVLLTIGLFARRWWMNREKKGCGGGCGCSAKFVPENKTGLRR